MNTIEIFGTKVAIPEINENTYIEDWGTTNPKEQYWRRLDLPDFFNEVEYDKDGNALLTNEQMQYARKEVDRCKNGFWFMNCGEPTYITGKNYFYLKFWKLEDDIYPDYRDIDRRYFLFLNHWEKVPWCLGIIIGKKRRQGATSVATSNLIYECIFYKNSFCGFTSKTQIDAKTAFTNMISFGYRQLPVFLKPKQLNNKDSVSELVFAHKSVEIKGGKGNVIDNDTGHRSKVDYRAPSLNAYDSSRMSRICADEGAKLPKEVPFSTLISIISKTLIKGIKKVGFMELPSTTNAMENGGSEFKIVWDNANQFKYEKTPNRLVKYLTPAYDGYMGFIDRYGKSVIDEPTEEQYKYLVENYVGIGDLTEEDVRLGARRYLLKRRENLKGTLLEEEIRMNPFDEREMFMLRNANCHFDAVLLNDLYETAKANETEVVEYGNFVWENGVPFTKAIWHTCDKENARWHKAKGFKLPEGETVTRVGNMWMPLNTTQFISASDPFQNNVVESGKGSKASSGVLNRFDKDGTESIYHKMFVCKYHARPQMAKLYQMDMILQCFAFGCQILFEAKMDGGAREYFIDNNCEAFLMAIGDKKTYGIDPNSDNKILMVNLWEDYILTHGKQGKIIYPDVIDDEFDGLLKFNVNETEVSDQVMGLGWTLVADYYKSANLKKQQDNVDITSYFKAFRA